MSPALSSDERDRNDLIRLGKKPVLLVSPVLVAEEVERSQGQELEVQQRNFGFMSILGFSCTVLITWETSLEVLDFGLDDGGPSGIIYGFIIVWVGSAAIYACLCELASMAPTAGGQYHWVSMLAPANCRRILSYLTGFLTVIGWQANLASSLYISASMVQGIVVFNKSDMSVVHWQTVLILWAVVLYCLFINAVVNKLLPTFESIILILHILAFPAILLPIVFLGHHNDAAQIFRNFTNEGALYTEGIAVLVGLVGNVFCFLGGDAAIHMSEEIRGASKVVPRAILSGILLNGTLGLGILIAVLYRATDLDEAAVSSTGYAYMAIFLQATRSQAGSLVMLIIILILQFACSVGLMAATSRMTWSFARDRGLPGWRIISKVDPRTHIPLASVLLTATISVLLSLIIFGSVTAFNNLVSISVVGLYLSYFMATGLLLYRRLTGAIRSEKRYESDVVNTVGAQLIWGPWRMQKHCGAVVNIYACIWSLVMAFFSLWPTELPVTAENMQYSVVVVGGVIAIAVIWYLSYGRRDYHGPVIESKGTDGIINMHAMKRAATGIPTEMG